jgi:3-hydroxybutyryl-CoA dehydrogenase
VFARILGAILNEAALALDEGVATSEDIDTAMRLGTNYPRGPLEWIGTIGKRRCMETLAAMTARTKDDRYRPAKYFKEP